MSPGSSFVVGDLREDSGSEPLRIARQAREGIVDCLRVGRELGRSYFFLATKVSIEIAKFHMSRVARSVRSERSVYDDKFECNIECSSTMDYATLAHQRGLVTEFEADNIAVVRGFFASQAKTPPRRIVGRRPTRQGVAL